MRRALFVAVPLAIAAGWLASCSTKPIADSYELTREQLQNPESCKSCHENHYNEWSGSMHAYAGDDPIFRALNKKMLRETNGANPTFCVQCHAPMAVREGATKDGNNLDQLPASMRGVTCYFCHGVDAVEGTHNNPLRLASDGVLRGGIADPVENKAHAAGYSALHDREQVDSAKLCGTCHDIVSPLGAHVERTYSEWQSSLFANPQLGKQLTCGKCHTEGRSDVAANAPGVGLRTVHDHKMAGVDIALTPFAQTTEQRAAVQANLNATIVTKMCVRPGRLGTNVEVTIDNGFVGHGWPSGAMPDRRAWLEVEAFLLDASTFSSGKVSATQSVKEVQTSDWLVFGDRDYTMDKKLTHNLWEVASYDTSQLSAPVTNNPQDPRFYHSITKVYEVVGDVDRVTMAVHIRPIDLDVADELIASGDLDSKVRDELPTFTLQNTVLEWTSAKGFGCVK